MNEPTFQALDPSALRNPLYRHSIFTEDADEEKPDPHLLKEKLIEDFLENRSVTEELVHPLSAEDMLLSATPETSPPKWHLAHTTWFFERFILVEGDPDHTSFHPWFDTLFNSYYETLGPFLPKSERNLISRPPLQEILRYRSSIDEQIQDFFESANTELLHRYLPRLELGIHHEQQHQELLLMDIKRNFYENPLRPSYDIPSFSPEALSTASDSASAWKQFPASFASIGVDPSAHFAFDNETSRHRVWIEPFEIASSRVTNGEYREFIEAGGYENPEYWLSDGWRIVKEQGWNAPLYWEKRNGVWEVMTLFGPLPMDENEPVSHLSYYEAQAFANWRECRLPTEAEWEHAASGEPIRGSFLEDQHYHPRAGSGMHGTLWEWTQSAYLPYPGYRAYASSLREYNSKFMVNQCVLRGGSFATPRDHYRTTYRNYYEPAMRWQFAGFRLARSLS